MGRVGQTGYIEAYTLNTGVQLRLAPERGMFAAVALKSSPQRTLTLLVFPGWY